MIGQLFAAIESLVLLVDQIVFGYAHSTKVADLAAGAATALGWSSDRVNRLRLASLLHDIGHLKILADRRSLDRVPPDSPDILNHPTVGANYLSQWEVLRELHELIANHQERIDGKGYPFGISGSTLSQDDQLLSLADVYVALTNRNDVRGRGALDMQAAIQILACESGLRWERELVDAFLQYVKNNQSRNA